MRLPRPARRRIGRAARISSVFSTATTVVAPFVMDVTANQLSTLGPWVPWAVMAGGATVSGTLWWIGHRGDPAAIDTPLVRPLPHVDELLGRDQEIAAIREALNLHGLVAVYGPGGIGTSSVATRVARDLVTGDADQRYVDLRGVAPDDAGSAVLRVVRGLGLDTRGSEAAAARVIADWLRDSGRVLLIDNVAGVRQVDWLARPVPGAYVVIAGDFPAGDLRDVTAVPVSGLGRDAALALLRRQETTPPPPGGLARMLGLVRGQPRNTIDARIRADQADADRLARGYLRFPGPTIQVGRWLARNPRVTIARLLRDLESGGMVSELRRILKETVAGASPGARRLLTLLTEVPAVEYPDAAVAALAGVTPDEAGERMAELGDRFLVHRTSSGSLLASAAAHLAEPAPPRAVAKAKARLLAHYAALADANADLLAGEQFAEGVHWFAVNDATLQALLDLPGPPRRAVRHLWVIADALDAWFDWNRMRPKRHETAELTLARARDLGATTPEAVTQLRLADMELRRRDFGQARRFLGSVDALGHGRTPWLPQLRTGWALWYAATHDLDAARNELDRAQQARPQRDLKGRMTDLINLGAIDIRAGLYGSAIDRLEEAARLARRADSAGGLAHARELTGIAECSQGRVQAAEEAWGEAESLYGLVGDEAALARCRRHRAACRATAQE